MTSAKTCHFCASKIYDAYWELYVVFNTLRKAQVAENWMYSDMTAPTNTHNKGIQKHYLHHLPIQLKSNAQATQCNEEPCIP